MKPETQQQENQVTHQYNDKFATLEKKNQFVLGLVEGCKEIWTSNIYSVQADEVTFDATTLWTLCEQSKDIYKLVNNLQYQIHANIPEVYAKIEDVSMDGITVRLIDRATMEQPFVEKWLQSKVQQRYSELTFDRLESFYKTQPLWVQHKHNFLKFLKRIFETIKKVTQELLSYKIDKRSKKVILQYAS